MNYEFNQFNSQTHGQLTFDQACEKFLEYVGYEPNMEYELIIGTDSLLHSDHKAEFVSAIVIHRKRSGGIYFWSKRHETNMFSLRQRMFQEALLSLRLAEQVINKLREKNIPEFNMSIHVDIGPNGETKKMVNEIVGMIKGSGFNVKTKPESYGASSVADRHT
ncbi:MAG: ribonuclease H-like YkuK family protein [Candidatus Doudnabacteria bacterium]|nr:ribonuclease H-like YkuK family protein [Candidatus Doudnabacteria bacterium]